MPSIFQNLQTVDARTFGDATLSLTHNLADTGHYSDEALAGLIERASRSDYHVSTMDLQSNDPKSRREGVIEQLTGMEVLDAIRNGNIWLNLRNVAALSPEHRQILEKIYCELEEHFLDFKSFNRQMTILISSPNVRVGYHSDVPGQTLWQIRGRKRVWVYPGKAPFLPQDALENILLGEAHEVSLTYQPEFDNSAETIDLEPGQMLTWAHNAPHRVVNHDCLNVSVTTEHWTPAFRNSYAVNFANGLLRKKLGLERLSQETRGASLYPKIALAAAYKFSGFQKKKRHVTKADFRVDPGSPGGFVDIPAYELRK